MELTENHIDQLYKFTRKHFVEHYDVQTELVDHLANDIESTWQEKPDLSFEEAKIQSFKKFGVFGFSDVVKQKQKQMTKKYWKILWRFVKEWFTVPKIIITATIFFFFFFFFFFRIEIGPPILAILFVILFVFGLVCEFIIMYKVKLKKKRKEKVFLLEEMIHQTQNWTILISFVNIFNIINIFDIDFLSLSMYWSGLISFFLTLLTLIFYITQFTIPEKAEELLEETYPEYKMSS